MVGADISTYVCYFNFTITSGIRNSIIHIYIRTYVCDVIIVHVFSISTISHSAVWIVDQQDRLV